MPSSLIDTNADQVADWFDDQEEYFGNEVDEMLQAATDKTYEVALEKVPVDTGDLKDSLTKDDQEVYSTLEYAPHVGLGTIYMEGTDYLWGPAEEAIKQALKQLSDKRS